MILMVVDDDRLNLKVAEELLRNLYPDSRVLLCQNPLEVPALLEANEVDILFLDIVMPQRSGMDVLDDIRSDARFNDMPIIMLTSLTDMEHFSACFDRGANDYVLKPIQVVEFQARLKAAVQTRGHMKLIREMYRQVKMQNADLRKLNAQLKDAQFHMVQQEKLASIGELAAGIAHEINNPIGFVSSNVDTLQAFFHRLADVLASQRDLLDRLSRDPELPEGPRGEVASVQARSREAKLPFILSELDPMIDDMRGGIQRVTKIVQTLRNFARTGLDDEMLPCRIDDVIDEAILIVHNESEFVLDFLHEPGDCGDIICNRGQIGQVFLNLFVNAIQAIRAQQRQQKGCIRVRSRPVDGGVEVVVEDDGPGIPDATKMRIFDPFFTTKDVGQGTGLGLSISHDIIARKHGGVMRVEDSPSGGARFVLTLPYRPPHPATGEEG